MLALVVGGAAPVETVALARQRPRIEARAPLALLAADHVAMAVAQDRERVAGLAALGDEERPARRGVRHDAALAAERRQRRRHLLGEIALELRRACGILALGADGDAPGQLCREAAAVEMLGGAGDGSGAGHGGEPLFAWDVQGIAQSVRQVNHRRPAVTWPSRAPGMA